jgi:hypothetical protein
MHITICKAGRMVNQLRVRTPTNHYFLHCRPTVVQCIPTGWYAFLHTSVADCNMPAKKPQIFTKYKQPTQQKNFLLGF